MYVLLGDELKRQVSIPTTTQQPVTRPSPAKSCPLDRSKRLNIFALNNLIKPTDLKGLKTLDTMCQTQSDIWYKQKLKQKPCSRAII